MEKTKTKSKTRTQAGTKTQTQTKTKTQSQAKAKTLTKTQSQAETKTPTKTRTRITKADRLRASMGDGTVKLEEDRIIKEIEENSIYINETQLNEKIINNFYKYYKRKIKRSDFITLLLCGLILIGVGINYLLEGNDYFFGIVCNIVINVFLIALGIYLCVYDFKYQKYDKKESKKIYNEDISKFKNYYYFENNRLTIVNNAGKTNKLYKEIYFIYEAKHFYYILLTPENGLVMSKDAFTKGKEEDFHKFIKEKMGKSFKKR